MLTRHHLKEAARLMSDYSDSPDSSTDIFRVLHQNKPVDHCWVHALNADQFRVGQLFGWRDESSPTGYLSGFIVETDPKSLRVLVRDIAHGKYE